MADIPSKENIQARKVSNFDPDSGGFYKRGVNATNFDPAKGTLYTKSASDQAEAKPAPVLDSWMKENKCKTIPEFVKNTIKEAYPTQIPNPLTGVEHRNLQLAFNILKYYFSFYNDTWNIFKKCVEIFDTCGILFSSDLKVEGEAIKKSVILINSNYSRAPFIIASILIHEGYHCVKESEFYLDEEYDSKILQLQYYSHLEQNIYKYLKNANSIFYYSDHLDAINKYTSESVLTVKYFNSVLATERNIKLKNTLIDYILGMEEYSKYLDIEWIVKNWDSDKYGKFVSREKPAVQLFLKKFIDAKGGSKDQLSVFTNILMSLKKDKNKGIGYVEPLADDAAQFLINNVIKDEELIKWLKQH
ncbi:hypothetical protein SanaruYs_36380 [Chryseotalea sanaruensis]|uniref:Uncharacterized protein n=1 Tax=Chryseotalea sanaruensis TaxID=2482724 RepID=A0A401UEQ2_9BACT|nr:hypothetical protein [Chryseotalea sanaruensis]GCC53395.1 hypothetical protein SanaruYs_36380 [Chryseotalea sanaruensis]